MTSTEIVPAEREPLSLIGYGEETERAGTCLIVDQGVRHVSVTDPQVEILPLADALRRYDEVQDLMFGLIDPEENEHVAQAAETTDAPVGRFIRVREGARVRLPLQLFTLVETPQARQFVHNVMLVEHGAEVEVISGSTVTPPVHRGHHVSISETYLLEGARCRETSVERWGEDMEIHEYSRTRIGPGARLTDNQIMLSGLRYHHSESATTLDADASLEDRTVLFSPTGTERILETEIRLVGRRAHAESITRMVTAGGSIENRSTLIGDGADSRGYLGCDGLKLLDEGPIVSAPALMANVASAQLSHEASVGMIAADKLAYLMASGIPEERARSLIVQGFLNLDQQLLPPSVREEVSRMIAVARSGAL